MPNDSSDREPRRADARLLAEDGTVLFSGLRVVSTSARYEIVRGIDAIDHTPFAIKAPRFDEAQQACLALEQAVLCTEGAGLPGEARLLNATVGDGAPAQSVLVLPWVAGKRLDRYVAENGPTGLDPEVAIGIARDVHSALEALHAAGFVHRRVCPEHVLVDAEGRATLIGMSHATARSSAHPGGGTFESDPYAAPEIQRELSGRFNTPRADVYALGMLLAYAATGERPTGNVSAPLTRTGFLRLYDQPEGIGLLIGRCTQPLQKNRISMRGLGEWLRADALPTRSSPGFGPLELIAAWAARDPADMAVSTLSPGPLVNRSAPAAVAEPRVPSEIAPSEPAVALAGPTPSPAPPSPAPLEEPEPATAARRWPRAIGGGIVLLAAIAMAWLRLRSG